MRALVHVKSREVVSSEEVCMLISTVCFSWELLDAQQQNIMSSVEIEGTTTQDIAENPVETAKIGPQAAPRWCLIISSGQTYGPNILRSSAGVHGNARDPTGGKHAPDQGETPSGHIMSRVVKYTDARTPWRTC